MKKIKGLLMFVLIIVLSMTVMACADDDARKAAEEAQAAANAAQAAADAAKSDAATAKSEAEKALDDALAAAEKAKTDALADAKKAYDAAIEKAVGDAKTASDAEVAAAKTAADAELAAAIAAADAAALKASKDALIGAVNMVFGSYNQANYSAAQWKVITDAVAAAKTAINDLTAATVSTYDFKAALAPVATAKDLTAEVAEARATLLAAIDAELAKYKEADYLPADWATLVAEVEEAKTAVNGLTTLAETVSFNDVDKALLFTAMESVLTEAAYVPLTKETKIAELNAFVQTLWQNNYSVSNWAILNGDIAFAKEVISGMDSLAALDSFDTDDVIDQANQITTLPALGAQALSNAQFSIENNQNGAFKMQANNNDNRFFATYDDADYLLLKFYTSKLDEATLTYGEPEVFYSAKATWVWQNSRAQASVPPGGGTVNAPTVGADLNGTLNIEKMDGSGTYNAWTNTSYRGDNWTNGNNLINGVLGAGKAGTYSRLAVTATIITKVGSASSNSVESAFKRPSDAAEAAAKQSWGWGENALITAATTGFTATANGIGTVEYTDASLAKIVAAETAYANFTDAQKGLVDSANKQAVEDARVAFDALEKTALDNFLALVPKQWQIDTFAGLADVESDDYDLVKLMEYAFDVVTAKDMLLDVPVLPSTTTKLLNNTKTKYAAQLTVATKYLNAAYTEIVKYISDAEINAATTGFNGLVDAIGTVAYTTASLEKILAAETAYGAFTDMQKALANAAKVTTMETARTTFNGLETTAVSAFTALVPTQAEIDTFLTLSTTDMPALVEFALNIADAKDMRDNVIIASSLVVYEDLADTIALLTAADTEVAKYVTQDTINETLFLNAVAALPTGTDLNAVTPEKTAKFADANSKYTALSGASQAKQPIIDAKGTLDTAYAAYSLAYYNALGQIGMTATGRVGNDNLGRNQGGGAGTIRDSVTDALGMGRGSLNDTAALSAIITLRVHFFVAGTANANADITNPAVYLGYVDVYNAANALNVSRTEVRTAITNKFGADGTIKATGTAYAIGRYQFIDRVRWEGKGDNPSMMTARLRDSNQDNIIYNYPG